MDQGFKITGVQEIAKALDDLPEKLEKKYLRTGLKDLATDIAKQVSASAPRAASHDPVRTRHSKGGKGVEIAVPLPLADSIKVTGGSKKGFVKAKVSGNFYAKFLEFGTYKMGPRPFVRPVMDTIESSVLQKFLDGLAKLVGQGK